MNKDDVWLTPTAWAATLGISKQAAHKAVRRLGIELVDGKLHAVKATAIYRGMTRPRVRVSGRQADAEMPPPSDAPRVTYDEARRREAVATAEMRERESALQAGELVRRADVERGAFEVARELRDRLATCARRIASEVAAIATAEGCEAVIDREHRIVLELLVAALRAKLGSEVKT